MRGYIAQVWAAKANLRRVEGFDVNGMPAAWALAPVRGGEALLAAIAFDDTHIFRFVHQVKGRFTDAQRREFNETVRSFRRISEAEAAALEPLLREEPVVIHVPFGAVA